MKDEYSIHYSKQGAIEDIIYSTNNTAVSISKEYGKERELALLRSLSMYEKEYTNILPIFVGFGCGFAIQEYALRNSPYVVIDLENISSLIQSTTFFNQKCTAITGNIPFHQIKSILEKQVVELGYPLCIPIVHPFIKKYHKEHYQDILHYVKMLFQYNPFGKTHYKRFTKEKPHILCLWRYSFIADEIRHALITEKIPFTEVAVKKQEEANEYISTIVGVIQKNKPDFILTLNHTGFDKSTLGSTILSQLDIPIASWFMDNPELDIEVQPHLLNDKLTVFTYDEENLPYLHSLGIKNRFYLPLGTNIDSFKCTHIPEKFRNWKASIGFLGNSHMKGILGYSKQFSKELNSRAEDIAEIFRVSSAYTVLDVVQKEFPLVYTEIMEFPISKRRDYIQLIISIATQTKRIHDICNASILPITVLGDAYWASLLPHTENIQIGGEVPYTCAKYIYAQVEIMLNSTCTQMKGGVNQRVFDCPISGALVVTEPTQQLKNLFEIGTEVVCYENTEDLQEKLLYYHKNIQERQRIVHKAQQRIQHEHTWGKRVQKICEIMKNIYG